MSQDAAEPANIKQCCAAAYSGEAARWLLGESFHPGGIDLTLELASALRLTAASRVLDAAAGRGTSAFAIAERFGCSVYGLDLSAANVAEASDEARRRGLDELVHFVVGDAESIPFADGMFDALLCECAFCTFPGKQTAASEFARVVRDGGTIGMSDLTKSREYLPDLEGLLAWVACIGDARPASEYVGLLADAGFSIVSLVARDDCLGDMIEQIRGRILLAELMRGLKRLDLPGFELETAKGLAAAAARAVRTGLLGYVAIVGEKSAE